MPLIQPPRDGDGKTVPHDHEGITADCGIIRRISEYFVVDDDATGQKRISTMAFRASSGDLGGMSVDIEASIVEAGLDPIAHVTSPTWIGSVRFTAQTLRNEQLKVGFDPIDENPHHGQAWGQFPKSKQKRLRNSCTWYVAIDGVALGDA